MADVNGFSSLFHVSNDIFNLVIPETFSSGRKDIFVVWLGCVILGEGFVSKARLSIFFSLGSVHTASLTSSYLTHLGLVAGKFDQILTIVRELRNLFALQTGEQSLEHGESAISIKLERNCREEISFLQLCHNIIKHIADILLGCEWRRKLCLAKLLIELRVRLGEGCQAGLEPCFILLGLIERDAVTIFGFEELLWIILFLQHSAGENSLHSFPQGYHVSWGHGQGCHQLRLGLQAFWGHGRHGVEFHHFQLLLSVFALRFSHNPTLKVDETSVIFFKKDFFSRCINNRCRYVLIENIAQPRLKLSCVTNSSTQSKERTVTASDDTLQCVTFWAVKGMDLIENKIIELGITTI
mmetsp:Transcript_11426/g.17234  ORF Transcript_11426/g.17234 Transcript_11426/m.17234 type:complete len:354 (-) Transcript_11426:1428-2489(-)